MKLPIHCPICHEPMLTEYKGVNIISKKCSKHIGHHIILLSTTDTDEVIKVQIMIDHSPPIYATWHLLSKELRICEKVDPHIFTFLMGTHMPYFEPDLSDYAKLVKKIKTYLLFS